MYTHFLLQLMSVVSLIVVGIIVLRRGRYLSALVARLKQWEVTDWLLAGAAITACMVFVGARLPFPLHFAMPPTMHSQAPGEMPPSLPIVNAFDFLWNVRKFERLDDIGADPTKVPAPIARTEPATVQLDITAKEVIAQVVDGVYFNYWTYNGQVPGPMFRIRVGDTVELTLHNDASSLHPHNIDLHAVTGPGGGASVTQVQPGESKSFRWKALNPGLYVYHCATPNVSTHNSHGQYGLILVEPSTGLAPVDKEFYVMQGELYTRGKLGSKGLAVFDAQALLDGQPNYITFNGNIKKTPRLHAQVGDRVRIYVGNGGVNLISSFHVIGEIFDRVYPEAAIGPNSKLEENVQTTAVLPGGASIVEFTVDVPGNYLIVDHALARMNKGAWMILEVSGSTQPDIFTSIESTTTDNQNPVQTHGE